MKKTLTYLLCSIAICFLLFFPFIHIGGDYYRGLILIWHQYPMNRGSSGGFINLGPDINWYEIVWWANPFTFRYVENGYAVDSNHVYLGERLDSMDVETFRVLGNGFYGDKNSVRLCGGQIKKRLENESALQDFDPETLQRIGENFVKDKTGIYYLSPNDTAVETNKYHALDMRIEIFRRVGDVDNETFVHVGKCLFKDKNFLYRANICGNISCETSYSLSIDPSKPKVLEVIKSSSDL